MHRIMFPEKIVYLFPSFFVGNNAILQESKARADRQTEICP